MTEAMAKFGILETEGGASVSGTAGIVMRICGALPGRTCALPSLRLSSRPSKMESFRSVLHQLRAHAAFRAQRLQQDPEAAALAAALEAAMRQRRKPLCLVAWPSLAVFVKGSPVHILRSFDANGEALHPASVCLSVRAVLRSIRKHTNERPKKRRKTASAQGAALLVS